MQIKSITLKSLMTICLAFLVMAVGVISVAGSNLRRIIDASQEVIFEEKLKHIITRLDEKHLRLEETMRENAYEKSFQHSFLEDFQREYYREGQKFYPFIIDGNGRAVIHKSLQQGDTSLANLDYIQKMLSTKERGSFEHTVKGVPHWVVFERFPPWQWVIAYTVPLEVKYIDASLFKNNLIVIITIITAVVLSVLSIPVMKFTGAISRLTLATSEIAAGNHALPLEINRTDEFGSLATSFAQMRDSIREKIDILAHNNKKLNLEIFERCQTETKLKESEELYRTLVDNIDYGVTFIGPDHTILMANATIGKMLNKSSENFYGKKCFREFEKNNHVCDYCPGIAAMATGTSQEVVTKGRRDDGSELTVRVRAFPVSIISSQKKGFIEVVEDITEALRVKKELQERQTQLAHAGRLTALGEMATGIAHEINQPLMIIGLATHYLNTYLAKNDPDDALAGSSVEKITFQLDRASNIINNMRSFARNSDGWPHSVNLYEPVKRALSFFKEQFRVNEIHLNESFAEKLPQVRISHQKIEQIVVNLISNARYAVEKQAEIEGSDYRKTISVSLSSDNENKSVALTVEDNGTGMTDEALDRCLEPFFTTKEVGEGTGLGLSITHSLVKEFHGKIDVTSNKGLGSIFCISIPVLEVHDERAEQTADS